MLTSASRTLGAIALLGAFAWWVSSLDALKGDSWRALLRAEMAIPCGVFLLFSLAAWILRGIRWALFMNERSAGRWLSYITAYGIGFALGAVTPARSGDLLRISLTGRLGHTYTRITGAYIVERVSDLLLLCLILALGLSLVPLPLSASLEATIWIMVLALSVIYVLLGSIAVGLERTPVWSRVLGVARLSAHAAQLHAGFEALAGHRNHLLLVVLGLSIWGLHVAATTCFLTLVFPDLPVVAGLLFLTLTNISGLVQLTPGNIGPYEVVGMIVLERLGVAAPDALAATTALHAFSLLCLTGYGGACYLARNVGRQSSNTSQSDPND